MANSFERKGGRERETARRAREREREGEGERERVSIIPYMWPLRDLAGILHRTRN